MTDRSTIGKVLHVLGTPFRTVSNAFVVLVNLSSRQVKSLFSVAMLGGIIVLSFHNIAYTCLAQQTVGRGPTYSGFFKLVQEQMRFNSALIAWFALIMGLIVFGADYFRAKIGDKEVGFGRGAKEGNVPFASLDDRPEETPEIDPDNTKLEDAG